MYSHDDLSKMAECLISEEELERATAKVAEAINRDYVGKELELWPVLNSAIVFTGLLLPKLAPTVKVSCLRVSRYAQNQGGNTLNWYLKPDSDIKGKHILVCDDIFDEGKTLLEVSQFAEKYGAASVRSVVMTNKIHSRKPKDFAPDYIATEIPDRYVFGMGMDYKDYWRNAPGIWAVKDNQ